MKEETKQLIEEQLQLLPRDSREVISSFNWVGISKEISKKYFLTEEELDILEREIAIAMLGLENQGILALNIEENIGVSKSASEKIAEEITSKILKPIIETLERNIKMTLKTRAVHWQQNINFILSGGDYTAFIRDPEKETRETTESPGTSTTFNQSKLDDLKSKFTI